VAPAAYNLAIETTTRTGSVTLGRGDERIATAELPPQRRHSVDLMPEIDRLCRARGIGPRDLAEIYISIGPGSFTGLRIGVTTAKTLAHVLNLKVVAVETLDVIAQNAPADLPTDAAVGVGVNLKGDTVYACLFRRDGARWTRAGEPALATLAEFLAKAPPRAWLLGDPLPPVPAGFEGVTVLPQELASPRSDALWGLGRDAARRGRYVDPPALLPLYVREPEAEELWKKRNR
jgi:tRNA threonylcarbamoyladenosine biosynthesis protein TsaB